MSDIAVQGGEASTQSDPVSSFSFSNLHEQAMNFGNDTQSATPAEQVAPPVPDPAAPPAQPDGATNVDGASAAQLAALKDTDLVEVTVDGQPVQMPWSEARGGVMRQAKFTKEMQRIRAEEQAFATERTQLQQAAQEREALVSLLRNEDLMKQFLAKQFPNLLAQQQAVAAAQQQVDPDDIATVGQIQAAQQNLNRQIEQVMSGIRQELQTQIASATQTIEDRQAAAKLGHEVSSTISQLFNEHPYISKVVPHAEQVLRYEVMNMRPSTPEEALDAIKTVFGGWVENYRAAVGETTKQSVLDKQKLVQNNIQPPGGVAPQTQPTQFKTKDGKVDWNALRGAALNMLG